IVRAVSYCHRLHVVHRDLKPENVVFFPQQGAVKLTDFGFSNLFQPGTMLATSCGSLAYSAPEILLGEEYDAPAVDIWSLGVILYMLVCGVPPFQETNDSETLVMILDCRYAVPDHVSDDCSDLISRMLQKDPSHRASLDQIEAHRWLQGLDDALLTPEAPPHWLSGALSPSSPRCGVPECGDLLAARPPTTQQPFPGPWQPSLSLTLRPPPAEEPPVAKNLPALQLICEEEEEEEEEDEEEAQGLGASEETVDGADNQDCREEEEELGGLVEIREEEEEEEEMKMEVEKEDSASVISDQPVGHGEQPESPTPEVPPCSPAGLGVPCCRGQSDLPTREDGEDEEAEPNNNNNKLPQSDSSVSASSIKEALKTGERTGERRGDDDDDGDGDDGDDNVFAERPPPHNTAGEPAPGKRHSIKLRERLFQFPLCEKALAFNLPAHNNKPKILPLAQYNCCHVL
ncbi:LOW QUALITY PROTEIN: SNF related kinase b, partial [Embiotoca jacksoni]|uniref:LOW QUALITY PROTEIN: SNF related kinase b n=1 Tax=Embiotoca jacksoni TaxID=100190 RepID=UPI003704683C